MGKTEKLYLECPYRYSRYGGVYFTWCMSLCDIDYDELNLLIYYYNVLLLAWFPLGYTDAFSISSFQITITID